MQYLVVQYHSFQAANSHLCYLPVCDRYNPQATRRQMGDGIEAGKELDEVADRREAAVLHQQITEVADVRKYCLCSTTKA